LGTTDQLLTLETLGMLEDDLADFRQAIERPHGVIFLTGPTGSGKSTTLYSALKEINTGWRNIVTVEDPIEQVVAGISQVQVGASDKVTFHSALRALLRHDPDVLMVGEVRDLDTADTALKAALTGHLVLSSLHTNTAAGAITRLVDFGCEAYLVGATLLGAVSQRLVRRLCRACREPVEPTAKELQVLGDQQLEGFYRPVGCPQCLGKGYAGRIGLFECFWVDDAVRRSISSQASESEIVDAAKGNHRSMLSDGLRKVGLGLTTLSEVVRVTRGEVG
jgi:type IV pilus assembly protein PilB